MSAFGQAIAVAIGLALVWLGLSDVPARPTKPMDIPTARVSRTGLDSWPDIRVAVKLRIERELKLAGFEPGAQVFIRIFKQSRELQVFLQDGAAYRHYRTYPICNFSGGLGPKLRAGDLQSPEGFYNVTPGLMNPNSKFHLAFNLGYPNAFDQALGRTGSALMVHGNCVSIGCYAMTDAAIEEIYFLVDAAQRRGQKSVPVHAFPYRMNGNGPLDPDQDDFWENLKEGYDAFEATKNPPKVTAKGGRYIVTPVS
ncbi:MAG: murein L,D-transpeptidase family protein [Deltaproteobacteria bacterium]